MKPAQYDVVGASYDSVSGIDFYRPSYLRILTVLLTLLIVLATAYGVFTRPFTQIIPTVGGLVLGVWGVRSLLVGGYPPDSTGVDLVLEASILLLLLAVTARDVLHVAKIERHAHQERGRARETRMSCLVPWLLDQQQPHWSRHGMKARTRRA